MAVPGYCLLITFNNDDTNIVSVACINTSHQEEISSKVGILIIVEGFQHCWCL